MATRALRCVNCGRERPRNAPVCDACERRLREAAELSKPGVDLRKDHVTGHYHINISRDASRESWEWFEQVCAIVRRFAPIRTLEIGSDGEFVEDLLALVQAGSALHALHLAKTQVADRVFERIREFASLEVLDLSRTGITDAGLQHLAYLAHLSRLSLYGTRITANGLTHLQGLPVLKILDLNWTNVDDVALVNLARMSALRHVDLKGTRMTFSAVKAFSSQRPDVAVDWAPTLKLIGYWPTDGGAEKRAYAHAFHESYEDTAEPVADLDSPFIHPRDLVDSTWAGKDRSRVVQYLARARAVAHAGGLSYCRFGCGLDGCAELSDGVWLWPEGLAHYVAHHGVRLPDEFLDHVRNRGYSPLPADEVPIDFGCQSSRFWRAWCATQKTICRERA